MFKNENIFSISNIVITVIATIIIVILSFLYYYVLTNPNLIAEQVPVVKNDNGRLKVPEKLPEKIVETPNTEIIYYTAPSVLPTEIKNGSCLLNSFAQPYREDAWRCAVENIIYDPCFKISEKQVICQMNPLVNNLFLINLTKPLPDPSTIQNTEENWSWFVELEDGTYCAPFTRIRPFVLSEEAAYYGCKSNIKGEQIVLTGNLIKGILWTAKKVVFSKEGEVLTIKLSEIVNIKTLWQ